MFYKHEGLFHSDRNNSIALCKIVENDNVEQFLIDLMKYSNFPAACPILKASL